MPLKETSLSNIDQFFCKENTKNQIILALSRQPNLTGLEVFLVIRKSFGKKLTYQAIHKALQELANEQILLKEDKKYFINANWLKKIKKQVDSLVESLNLIRHSAQV